jgi:hypothetical protein
MKKVVKLKQIDVESIVENVIKENQEIDERMMGPDNKMHYVYAAKDSQGNILIRDIKTDELLARHNSSGDNQQSDTEDSLPMAAE